MWLRGTADPTWAPRMGHTHTLPLRALLADLVIPPFSKRIQAPKNLGVYGGRSCHKSGGS